MKVLSYMNEVMCHSSHKHTRVTRTSKLQSLYSLFQRKVLKQTVTMTENHNQQSVRHLNGGAQQNSKILSI